MRAKSFSAGGVFVFLQNGFLRSAVLSICLVGAARSSLPPTPEAAPISSSIDDVQMALHSGAVEVSLVLSRGPIDALVPFATNIVLTTTENPTNTATIATNIVITAEPSEFFRMKIITRDASIYDGACLAVDEFIATAGTNRSIYAKFGTTWGSIVERRPEVYPFAFRPHCDNFEGGWDTLNGVMVATNAAVYCSHFHPRVKTIKNEYVPCAIRYYRPDGKLETRYAEDLFIHNRAKGEPDLSLLQISTFGTIEPVKLLHDWEMDMIPTRTPIIMIDRFGKWLVQEPLKFSGSGNMWFYKPTKYGQYARPLAVGESGTPAFVWVKGDWHLIGLATSVKTLEPVTVERVAEMWRRMKAPPTTPAAMGLQPPSTPTNTPPMEPVP